MTVLDAALPGGRSVVGWTSCADDLGVVAVGGQQPFGGIDFECLVGPGPTTKRLIGPQSCVLGSRSPAGLQFTAKLRYGTKPIEPERNSGERWNPLESTAAYPIRRSASAVLCALTRPPASFRVRSRLTSTTADCFQGIALRAATEAGLVASQ